MMPPTDYQRSRSEDIEVPSEEDCVQGTADELVFIQDAAGNYLSFRWQRAGHYGITPDQVLNGSLESRFVPVEVTAYRERVNRVLTCLAPERFRCCFHCGDQILLFDLVMSPILLPDRAPAFIAVAGRLAPTLPVGSVVSGLDAAIAYPAFSLSSDRYQKLLTQIAWNIRRTLDLPTIWHQTVKGLGKALSVTRCAICPYDPLSPKVKVVAEYCQEAFPSLVDQEMWVTEDPHLGEAIATLKPVVANSPTPPPGTNGKCLWHSMLVIATSYQDQPNGLIVLHQCDRSRLWSEAELELMQDLADQVGTAIAHATLLEKSQAQATELQLANSSLRQNQRELEEARHQAEEASRLKSEFLANTSHELRTPLNGMIGFLKLIVDGMTDNPEEEAEFIEEAYKSALHLNDILTDVLDLAKIEAGRLQIDSTPVKLDDLLEVVEHFAQPQVRQKNLYFEIQKPPTKDEIILYGDYQRLKQVMFNLVGNAIKFTHEGGITVSVEVIKKKVTFQNQECPGTLKFRVADTGIGVSLDMQDRLFQSFSQVDGSRTRQYGGTGLGLAISQKLVEAMGGVVNFYSMGEGLGSTVTFTVLLYQDPLMITA